MSTNTEGMATVVQALRDAHRQAVSDVDTLGSRISDGILSEQKVKDTLGALNKDLARINDLGSRLRDDVLAGRLAPEKWEEIARLTFDDMNAQVAIHREWPLSRILWETTAATAQDVQTGVVKVVAGGAPWLLLGIGAILALKFLPSRKS